MNRENMYAFFTPARRLWINFLPFLSVARDFLLNPRKVCRECNKRTWNYYPADNPVDDENLNTVYHDHKVYCRDCVPF